MSEKNTEKSNIIEDLFHLTGKRIFITAAAGGLGKAVSQALARFGVKITVTDIEKESLPSLVNQIEGKGSDVYQTLCDVTNMQQVSDAVQFATEKMGGIDILINIAGNVTLKYGLEMTEDEFKNILDCTLLGAFRCSKEVAKQMIKQGSGGSIVHTSSIAGTIALGRGTAAYAAAKAGLNAIVREYAVEWAQHQIRVNAIAPCQIRTHILEKALNDPKFGGREVLLKKMVEKIPLGRLGESEDVIGPIIFLASQASSMVTGQVLFVDGGYTVV